MRRALLIIPALLVGCSVGPTYEEPETATTPDWTGVVGDAPVSTRPAALATWWETFDEPALTAAVEKALRQSPTVREAAARVLEARALAAAERGRRVPQVDLNAGYTRSRTSETLDGFNSIVGGQNNTGGGNGFAFDPETDLFELGASASWELDLFGRLANRESAAIRNAEAELFDFRDVRVTLAADVALTFVEARELAIRLQIARDNVGLQQRSLDLAQARFNNGLTGELDVAEAISNLQQTKATIPLLVQQERAAKNRLAVLVGQQPGQADTLLQNSATTRPAVPTPPENVAIGIPADLLRRRPDIRRAERELARDVAETAAATGDLYPRLTLLGSFGYASGELDDLFDSGSRTFSVGPSFSWPIFQGGTLRALRDAADARAAESAAVYEGAVLQALADVADALTAYAQDRERRAELAIAEAAAQKAVALSDAQYRQGLIEFDRVLLAQQTLFTAQDALAAADAAVTADVVRLYRALGGGWQSLPQQAATIID